MSASEGNGGHGKADIDAWILFYKSVPNVDKGSGRGSKNPKNLQMSLMDAPLSQLTHQARRKNYLPHPVDYVTLTTDALWLCQLSSRFVDWGAYLFRLQIFISSLQHLRSQTVYVSAALTPLNSLTHDVARRLGKLGSVALWMDGRQVRSHVTVQVQRYTCNL